MNAVRTVAGTTSFVKNQARNTCQTGSQPDHHTPARRAHLGRADFWHRHVKYSVPVRFLIVPNTCAYGMGHGPELKYTTAAIRGGDTSALAFPHATRTGRNLMGL